MKKDEKTKRVSFSELEAANVHLANAELANKAAEADSRSCDKNSMEAGKALLEAKRIVQESGRNWIPWLEEQIEAGKFTGCIRTAQLYMKHYKSHAKNPEEASAFGSLRRTIALTRRPRQSATDARTAKKVISWIVEHVTDGWTRDDFALLARREREAVFPVEAQELLREPLRKVRDLLHSLSLPKAA